MAVAQDEGRLQDASDRVREVAADGWLGLQPYLDFQILRMAGLELTVGGILAALILLALAFVVSKLLARALRRIGDREGINAASVYTVTQIIHYVILALGVVLALEAAGIPISEFTVLAGAIGVGLGFGLQAIFNNFISGLILLFDRSIKVGDFVELESGVHGKVQDIKIRATRISTNDNLNILVPNSEFVSGRVVNWTLVEAARRMHIPFGVAYGTDKELVKKAALEAAFEVPFTLSHTGPRAPQVWLVEFGESSLDFELVVWLTAEATMRPSAVKAAYVWALHTALEKYHIEVPFPQRDLHIRSLFGHRGDIALELMHGRPYTGPHEHDGRYDEPVPSGPEELRGVDLSINDAQRDVERDIATQPPVRPPPERNVPPQEE